MTDVFIRATLEGFNEGKVQLLAYQDGLKQLQTQINQVQGKFGDAVSRSDFGAAQGLGKELAGLNERYKDLDVTINRLTPDIKGLTQQQKEMQAASGVAAEGMEKVGAAGIHLGLGSAYARREVLILGREIMEGHFSRIPGTMITLAAHTGLFSAAWIAVAAPVLGAAAAVGTFIAATVSGTKELNAMNNALIMTGNFAGMTQEHMASLSRTISNAGTLTVGTSRDIVTQIVASGQYSAENVGKLASLVDSYAAATGKSVKEVTPALIKMFEDPAKAAAAFSQQLSVAELEHIRTLQSTGKAQEAVSYALDLFIERIPKAVDNIGLLEKAYIATKKALSDMWGGMKDAALGVGTAGLDKALSDARRNIAELEARQKFTGSSVGEKELVVQKALLAELLKQEVARAKVAELVSAETKERKDQVKAQEEINKSSLNKISSLEKERDFIIENGVASVEKDRRVLEINKEIRSLKLSLGADSRALTNEQYASNLKLFDIETKRTMAQIDGMVKLGTMSEEEGNRKKLIAHLEDLAVQQAETKRQIEAGGLLPLEKAKLENKLKQQAADFASTAAAGGITEQLTAHNKLLKENAMLQGLNATYMSAMETIQDRLDSSVRGFSQSQIDVTAEMRFQTSLIGKTTAEQTMLTALHKQDLDYQKERNKLLNEEPSAIREKAVADLDALRTQRRAELIEAVGEHAEASKEINQFWKTAAKDMQRSMSSFFFDIMQGNLSDLVGNFKRTIDRMVADALAAKAALALFGPDFTKSGSTAPVGGFVGQALGWITGGIAGGPGAGQGFSAADASFFGGTSADALAFGFASGGSFTIGGHGGTDSQMVKFKGTPGERVTVETPGQQITRGGISITNVFNVSGAVDRRSQAQIAASAGEGVQRALSRNT